jgi:hypothetical protein
MRIEVFDLLLVKIVLMSQLLFDRTLRIVVLKGGGVDIRLSRRPAEVLAA